RGRGLGLSGWLRAAAGAQALRRRPRGLVHTVRGHRRGRDRDSDLLRTGQAHPNGHAALKPPGSLGARSRTASGRALRPLAQVGLEGRADELLESFLVQLIALLEVYGAAGTAVEARVEEAVRIGQHRPMGERQLHL